MLTLGISSSSLGTLVHASVPFFSGIQQCTDVNLPKHNWKLTICWNLYYFSLLARQGKQAQCSNVPTRINTDGAGWVVQRQWKEYCCMHMATWFSFYFVAKLKLYLKFIDCGRISCRGCRGCQFRRSNMSCLPNPYWQMHLIRGVWTADTVFNVVTGSI